MASTYLSKVQTTGTNRKIQTFSTWVKKCQNPSSDNVLFSSYYSADERLTIFFDSSQEITVFNRSGGSNTVTLVTNRLFRDVSAWYHIVVALDSTQATASNRVKIYVNGVQETSFATAIYPSLNEDFRIGSSAYTSYLGVYAASSGYFDGNMAHFNSIDGTAYPASTFGETDSLTGIWKPITSPSVTYGTNGFFLKFASSGSMGTDSSGNSNNFTVNGNLTQTQDTPSNVFATLNALIPMRGTATYNNGNTYFSSSYGDWDSALSTIGATQGKWYFETKWGNPEQLIIGCVDVEKDPEFLSAQGTVGFLGYQGGIGYLGEASSPRVIGNTGNNLYTGLTSISSGNIVGCAIDLDNREMFVHINGTYTNSGNPETRANPYDMSTSINSGGTVLMGVSSRSGYPIETNFGNGYFGTTAVASAGTNASGIGIFEYDVPTGYRALCTKSINAQEYS